MAADALATAQFDGLREQWYVACTSEELPHDKPLGVRVLDVGVVLFRQRDGGVCALIDQCVHRGTRLSAGKVQNDRLVCPYHGWQYDAEGQVVCVPSIDGVKPVSKQNRYPFRQRALPVQSLDGLV